MMNMCEFSSFTSLVLNVQNKAALDLYILKLHLVKDTNMKECDYIRTVVISISFSRIAITSSN